MTKPGFYGWPLCTGDNSAANSYFRYTFPNGPSGARFDCRRRRSRTSRPTTPAWRTSPARRWAPTSGTSARATTRRASASRPRPTPQESITGPIYDYDAANPSDTKWPAYYDGAWFMLDRAQNWWREARVRDDGSGLLRVNGLFGSSQFGSPSHTYPIPVKFGPDGSLYLATWDYDCCRAQLPGQLAPGG